MSVIGDCAYFAVTNHAVVFSAEGSAEAASHKYPSSSHYTRDWDKLVTEIKQEEKDEKLEGDQALNNLFQSIYADGNDETRKAMNKSFVSIYQLHLFHSLHEPLGAIKWVC